jgi:hypothetical protein
VFKKTHFYHTIIEQCIRKLHCKLEVCSVLFIRMDPERIMITYE